MRQNPTDDELLRKYLLGELPEDEADRLERRLLADDDLFELSEAVEADLLAACDRGELAPEERERVLQRLASSPQGRERLALARSLNTAARSSQETATAAAPVLPFRPPAPAASRPAFHWMALAAAVLLAAVGLYWIGLGRHGGEAPPWVAQERPAPASPVEPQVMASSTAPQSPATREEHRPEPKPEPSKAVFQLALATLRGAESVQRLHLAPGKDVVELQIAVEGMDDLKSFRIAVRNAAGKTVWDRSGLVPKTLSGVRAVVVDIPSDQLAPGKYEIQAQGTAPGQEPEDLSPLEVEVVRGSKG